MTQRLSLPRQTPPDLKQPNTPLTSMKIKPDLKKKMITQKSPTQQYMSLVIIFPHPIIPAKHRPFFTNLYIGGICILVSWLGVLRVFTNGDVLIARGKQGKNTHEGQTAESQSESEGWPWLLQRTQQEAQSSAVLKTAGSHPQDCFLTSRSFHSPAMASSTPKSANRFSVTKSCVSLDKTLGISNTLYLMRLWFVCTG